jgi:hypothetical protein
LFHSHTTEFSTSQWLPYVSSSLLWLLRESDTTFLQRQLTRLLASSCLTERGARTFLERDGLTVLIDICHRSRDLYTHCNIALLLHRLVVALPADSYDSASLLSLMKNLIDDVIVGNKDKQRWRTQPSAEVIVKQTATYMSSAVSTILEKSSMDRERERKRESFLFFCFSRRYRR